MRRLSLRTATTPRSTSFLRRSAIGSAVLALVGAGLVSTANPAAAASAHSPKGHLDSLSFTLGKITFAGWALDPDAGASVTVKVSLDGKTKLSLKAARTRTDVARKYPRYGKAHGFAGSTPATNGTHTLCITAVNIAKGSNSVIGCGKVTVNNNPVGALDALTQGPHGVAITGWSLDPNNTGTAKVDVRVDGHLLARVLAKGARTPVSTWRAYGTRHGFSLTRSMGAGTHEVCLYGVNQGAGTTGQKIACRTIKVTHDPTGKSTVSRQSLTTAVVSGYAYDPDSTSAVKVTVLVDGSPAVQGISASTTVAGLTTVNPGVGTKHGFTITVPGVDANQHQICVVVSNLGAGHAGKAGCGSLLSTGDLSPAQPSQVATWPGNKQATVTWAGARSVRSRITSYVIGGLPGGADRTVSGTSTQVTITGLVNGHTYEFSVKAVNALGTGSSTSVTVLPSNVPPQFSAAPISTSHYPRNWTGNLTKDRAAARAQGAADAGANPSNHRYLILQDIGGQDQGRGGVLLSATSKYFSYSYTVSVMQAYSDGYASRQKVYAPLILAIGTNNDVDVSAGSGAAWATKVVNPIRNYVAAHHPGIEVAGADDIEPGFSAGVAASRAWLAGFLGATSARFVFNGSADGCSLAATNRGCNNGWSSTDLQWLSGGAASNRIISLPQIYNAAMPLQWKYISLTGVLARKAKIYFGGTLTEWTACSISRCYSIGGNSAWNQLWSAIRSDARTRQYDMPFSTDLQIN